MRRVALAFAALLGFAFSSAQAAHPGSAPCVDRESVLCTLHRATPGYSGHKLSPSPTHRVGAKSRTGGESAANAGQARATNPTGKPRDGAAPPKPLAARTFDPLASGSDSGEFTARPPAASDADPRLKSILIALSGGGILSLFLAKAAEL